MPVDAFAGYVCGVFMKRGRFKSPLFFVSKTLYPAISQNRLPRLINGDITHVMAI
jgi:hypothetical protein